MKLHRMVAACAVDGVNPYFGAMGLLQPLPLLLLGPEVRASLL